jgi:NADH:ubiquinone oxidoreductase subunit D
MFKRMILALESIADSLKLLSQTQKEMREEQKFYYELSQKEANNQPARVKEMVEMIKQLSGGGGDS